MIESKDKSLYLNKIQSDSSFKGAYIRSLPLALYTNQKLPKEKWFRICKQPLMSIPVVIYTVKDFFLLDEMNEWIEVLKSAGLIQYWSNQDIDMKYLKVREESSLKPLNLEQLQGSFELLLSGYVLGFISLSSEYLLLILRIKYKT